MVTQASGAMETDGGDAPTDSAAASSAVGLLPELEIYAYLLVVTFLVDKNLYPEVCANPLQHPVLSKIEKSLRPGSCSAFLL